MRLTKNFDSDEFKCPCCGKCEMDKEFMSLLQWTRDAVEYPMKITSGWRCKEHNKEVSPKSMGDHTRGLACDVALSNRYKRAKMLKVLTSYEHYFKDIAIGKTYIHIGKGQTKDQGIGVYG